MCTRSRFRERRGISAPWDYLVHTDLVEILEQGFEEIRMRIGAALHEDESLEGMGLETVAVRIAAVRPEAEVEKALRTPTRESIQQQADEATFQRRALAVEKERAIQENELQNRIATDIVGGIVGSSVGKAGIPAEWISGIREWPRSVAWMEGLEESLYRAMVTGDAMRAPRLPVVLRNALFLVIVLLHGIRRLGPPY